MEAVEWVAWVGQRPKRPIPPGSQCNGPPSRGRDNVFVKRTSAFQLVWDGSGLGECWLIQGLINIGPLLREAWERALWLYGSMALWP